MKNFNLKDVISAHEGSRLVMPATDGQPYYVYGVRHSGEDWGLPITIEHLIVCNYWGLVKLRKPLTFPLDGDCITLTPREAQHLIDLANKQFRMNIKRAKKGAKK